VSGRLFSPAAGATAALLAAAALTVDPGDARAAVDRYAVVIGNDAGAADEPRLRFAEIDAVKVHDALKELGGFPLENLVLLRGESAAAARGAIITVNDRVRDSIAAGRQVLLAVYYSGHADADALHLGSGRFPLRELEQLVRGSAATVRVLIVDACRSGALTQAKGGTRAPPFPIEIQPRLAGEGAVFLTSTAVNEEAQESDAVGGSFFTHYLVSGLLGAADSNDDGQVSIEEAYRFSYENTLRASSRSLLGTQHPTFHYDLRGQGSLGLTFPFRDRERAQLRFPDGLGFLVLRGGGEGPVVAEVGVSDRVRRLSLKPGRYFLRGRGRDYLLEGTLTLAAGDSHVVEERDLERVQYARLVRKGGADRPAVSVLAGYQAATSIWASGSSCQGGFGGTDLTLSRLTVEATLGACRSRDQRQFVNATADTFDLRIGLWMEWDVLRATTVGIGATSGVALLHQHFATPGQAPSRWSTGAQFGAAARVTLALGRRYFLIGQLAAESLLIRRDQDDTGGSALSARGGGRGSLGAGVHLW
jgi:hypothetical protein